MPLPDLDDLFQRYHLALFRYAWRMTGQRDAAEDLTQEVFVRVLRGLERYQPSDREQAWLFRIARNLIIDRHRRAERTAVDRAEREAQPTDASGGAVQELSVQLQQSLDMLDGLDREVFLLREVGGLGYVDIAAVCELTPDAVRSRICRARSQLRRTLGNPATLARA